MKNYIVTGFTALSIGFVALSAAYADETVSVDQKLEAFREGQHGVYGRTPISDIGNVIAQKNWPMNKTWDGKTQDDASHFRNGEKTAK